MLQGELLSEKTLRDARDQLFDAISDGVRCPCCDQYARLYKRKLNSTMAYGLIWIAQKQRTEPDGWVDVPRLAPRVVVATYQIGTIAHWGLIEGRPNTDSKKKYSGFWRVTQKGLDFVMGEILIPERVHLYNNEVFGFSEEQTDIKKALGNKFDYSELMGMG